MSSKWKVLGAVVVAALVAALLGVEAKRREAAEMKKGHFFRLKVALTYKKAPVDIDIVVGCGIHYAWNRVSSSTDEISGMTAYFFATTMPEGHAVVIRTVPGVGASPCHGSTTANGDIDQDWLPLIAWYERDEDFAHGIAYATQDAYENPNARFGFRSATVEAATRADYDAFVATGRKNLWPPYLTDYVTHPGRPWITDKGVRISDFIKNPSAAWPYSRGLWYIGARRIRLTPEQRAIVHASWPADRPRFWGYKTESEQSKAWHELLTEDQRYETYNYYNATSSPGKLTKIPEIYSMLADNALAEINGKTPIDDAYIEHVLIDPALKGFRYLDFISPPEIIQAKTGRPATVKEGNITCKIYDYIVPTRSSCSQEIFWVAFEKDEFAIIPERPNR